jgi:hypothetical protein
MTRSSGAVLATLLACGCAGADDAGPGDRAAAVVDTVDGVERLSYGAERAASMEWGVDTLAVIGDALAEDAYQFDQVSPEGLASDGDALYLLDRQGKRVLAYDAEGRHRGTFGRAGEGPGELSEPLGLEVGPGDTVWVSDFRSSRLTGYPANGGDPRILTLPDTAGMPSFRFAALESGFVMSFRPLPSLFRGGGRASLDGLGESEAFVPLVRLDRDLHLAETLWRSPEPPRDVVQLESGGRMMVAMQSREFWPETLWDAFEDGTVVVADSAAYVLHLVSPDGTVLRRVRRDPAPRATTEADREAVKQRMREEAEEGVSVSVGGHGPGPDMRQKLLEERLEKMTFADLIPRILAIRIDPEERIWVGVSEDVAGEIARIDIYDRDGVLLGELRDVPMPNVFMGPDRFGVLRRDELDVQQVVLLAVSRPSRRS